MAGQLNVWDRQPELVHYATFVGGGSDKFYEVRLDETPTKLVSPTATIWTVTRRWGRNPDTKGGQSKPESFASRGNAVAALNALFDGKVMEGYQPQDWPHGSAAMPDFSNPDAVEEWLAT